MTTDPIDAPPRPAGRRFALGGFVVLTLAALALFALGAYTAGYQHGVLAQPGREPDPQDSIGAALVILILIGALVTAALAFATGALAGLWRRRTVVRTLLTLVILAALAVPVVWFVQEILL